MLAAALQHGLQRFAKPWNRMRALRVFRDETSLSVNPALWPSIEQALTASEYFILMASPEAAASEWVRKEVDYWLSHRPVGKLLIVLTDGELVWDENSQDFLWADKTPLPPNLRGVFEHEPRYLDLRWACKPTEHLSLDHNDFRDAIADLAATLHDRPKQDLIGEDVRQHKKIQLLTRGAIVALAVLAVSATVASIMAVNQRNEAERQRDEALRTQSLMLAEMSRKELESGDATNAILVALEALPKHIEKPNRPYVIEAEAALYQGVLSHREIGTFGGPKSSVRYVTFSPDGSRFVTAEWDGKARVFDSASGNQLTIFSGHKGHVLRASFSPDGTHVATASSDGTARVWDTVSGTEIAVMRGHRREPQSVTFSPDGSRVATTSIDSTARVWDARSGGQIAVLNTEKLSSVAFSPDGRRIVTSSYDWARVWDATDGSLKYEFSARGGKGTRFVFNSDYDRLLVADAAQLVGEKMPVHLWDTINGVHIAELPDHKYPLTYTSFSGDGNIVMTVSQSGLTRLWNAMTGEKIALVQGRGLALTADGSHVAAAIQGDERSVRVWDRHNDTEVAVLRGHEAPVRQATFSPDGNRMATISADGTVRIWDASTGAPLGVFGGFPLLHFYRALLAEFNADGSRLITHHDLRTVRLWDITSGPLVVDLAAHAGGLSYAAFSPEGGRVITASSDGTARISDAESGAEIAVLHGHKAGLTYAAFSFDGRRVATASKDGTGRVWNAIDGTEIFVLPGHTGTVWHTAFNPAGTRMVTTSEDNTARLWNATNGREIAVLRGHENAVLHAAFSPDGRRVATASSDRTVRIWDAASGAPITTFRGHRGVALRVAFSPDGHHLVSASKGGSARVWDVNRGTEIFSLSSQNHQTVWDAAFSPDGSRIVTASEDETARIWDAMKGTQLAKFTDHNGRVYRVAFSPDANLVASAGLDDHSPRLWHTHTGTAFAVLNGHRDLVTSVAFSPDGSRVLTASRDGTARLFRIFQTQELIDYARKTVPRQLTIDERRRFFLKAQ